MFQRSVEFCDCQGIVSQIVGKVAIDVGGSEVFISDHSEVFEIVLRWLDSSIGQPKVTIQVVYKKTLCKYL